ncbi:DUF1178 family protein [Devosia sp.]|uniref:DUF1178 family protein n=1 Tax=Devosia sp. TaxID=1871048 RepID=UPI003263BEDA
MIHYSLICDKQHPFDAWFRSAAAYDEQQGRGAVSCPACGSAHVEKALMAPAVARSGSGKIVVSNQPINDAQIRAALRAMRDKVVSEAENVGDKFAQEARNIHYDDAPARGIYGQASREEVADLIEEGIEFMPLPDLPDDHN